MANSIKDKVIHVRISEDELHLATAIANQYDISLSSFVSLAIRKEVQRHENGA